MGCKKIILALVTVFFGLIVLILAAALLFYPAEYVFRALAWQESDAFDWQKFPAHPLNAAPQIYNFDTAPDPGVAELFKKLSGADDWDRYLEAHNTQALIVIQDGEIRYENYFNDTQRDSIVTSFSVAKSFTSALIGRAVDDGYIRDVHEPITVYLPELLERDPRFKDITIHHLLLMASGLEYQEFRPLLFNSDDILTTYYPDQRRLALENTRFIDPPGQYFHYNKYHPQLLRMIIERATGMTVTSYLQISFWDALGMEYGGSWSTDSRASDFEKMETGVNARAIDFAKFGVLYLNGGEWQGEQVISKAWVEKSTRPFIPENIPNYYPEGFQSGTGQRYYNAMWWGYMRENGSYDFTAAGDKGQYIYVSPQKNLVIVRNGTDYGSPSNAWTELFYAFASQY